MRATATDGNARVFMAGIAESFWAKGFVEAFDFAAIVLDIETTANSTLSSATSRPTNLPSPFPTTSSSTYYPTPSPTTSSPAHLPISSTHFPTLSPNTSSPAHLPIPSATTLRPTDAPAARSDQTSSPVVVIAGSVAGVAVVVLVMALVVCCRKRVGRGKIAESLQPLPSQAINIPRPSGGTHFPSPPRDCTDVDALPRQHAKEAKGVPPYTSDRTDGREPAGVRAQDLITKPTRVFAMTSTTETTSVSMEVDTESPPLYDPRTDPDPEDANLARATNMPSDNRASTVYAGKPSRSKRLSIAEAVMEAAEVVANSSGVPGVSEAATLISTLVKLVVERQNSDRAAEWRLRWCRSTVTLLGQASEILGKVRQ